MFKINLNKKKMLAINANEREKKFPFSIQVNKSQKIPNKKEFQKLN